MSQLESEIAELRRQNEELRKSQEKYLAYFSFSPDGIFVVDAQGNYLEVNDSACRITGYSRKELTTMTVKDLVHEDALENGAENFSKLLNTGFLSSIDLCKKPDGSKYYLGIDAVKISDNCFVGFCRDETEKLRREQRLRQNEEKYRTLFDNSSDGMFLFSNVFHDCNEAAARILKGSREDILGKTILDISPEYQEDGRKSQEVAVEYLKQAYEKGSVTFEYVHKTFTGEPIQTDISLNRIKIGDEYYYLGVMRDNSERKQMERDLRTATRYAEEMNKLKSIFLANMSHELRTPMIGVLGFANILAKRVEDPQQLDLVHKISESGQRLMDTLNSIIDLSRIESNKASLKLRPLAVRDVLNQLICGIEKECKKKGLELSVSGGGDVLNVVADEHMLSAALKNILDNAVKYTPEGSITITIRSVNEDDRREVEISIADTGVGIPADYQDTIFEPFRQVSEGSNRNFEGSGIGLTIAKKYLEFLGGSISVKSREGEGSVFTVTLPLQ